MSILSLKFKNTPVPYCIVILPHAGEAQAIRLFLGGALSEFQFHLLILCSMEICNIYSFSDFPSFESVLWQAVLRIRIRIRILIHRIHVFLGLPDPDPLVRGMDPDPALDPDPSIIMQK